MLIMNTSKFYISVQFNNIQFEHYVCVAEVDETTAVHKSGLSWAVHKSGLSWAVHKSGLSCALPVL